MSKSMNRPYVYRGQSVAGVYQRCRQECLDPCSAHSWSYRAELPAGPTGRRQQLAKDGFATGKARSDRAV